MSKLPQPKFNLRLPNAEAETLISLILRYRGQRLVYSTGYSIHPKDWDFKTQRPIQQTKRPDLFAIKRQLDDLATYCIETFMASSLPINSSSGALTVEALKGLLDIKIGRTNIQGVEQEKEAPKKQCTFLEFLDLELEAMKIQGMKTGSRTGFERHTKLLKKFAKEVRPFNYDDVDWDFRLELIDWLASRNTKLRYGNKTLSVLRQFMERARRKKLHSNVQYQGIGWMVPAKRAVGEIVILTPEELQRLAELRLFDFADKVRDLFLIGAGTGQRFSDYSCYTPNNFYKTVNKIPILSMISQKTETPAKVPLNIFPWLIPTLEKHDYTSPQMSMQKFNVTIKDICKKAKLTDKVFIVEQYIGRKARVEKTYIPKYELVSSHTCRRSFATNMYRMGYRLAQIMPMTGHSTESQLREYIGIDNEQNAEEIAFSIMDKKRKGDIARDGYLKIVNP